MPTPQSKTETKAKEEKSFSFDAQGGKKITAYVYADSENPNRKMIIFTPFLDKTDGNLYNASLNALWSIYGTVVPGLAVTSSISILANLAKIKLNRTML